MYLHKSNHTDICTRLYKYRHISQDAHRYSGLYRQDLIVVSTYVIQNKLIAAFLSTGDLYNFYRSPI